MVMRLIFIHRLLPLYRKHLQTKPMGSTGGHRGQKFKNSLKCCFFYILYSMVMRLTHMHHLRPLYIKHGSYLGSFGVTHVGIVNHALSSHSATAIVIVGRITTNHISVRDAQVRLFGKRNFWADYNYTVFECLFPHFCVSVKATHKPFTPQHSKKNMRV